MLMLGYIIDCNKDQNHRPGSTCQAHADCTMHCKILLQVVLPVGQGLH